MARVKPAVHPRWRGEHIYEHMGSKGETGSSPLARGTLGEGGELQADYRFIPAGAGNTG